MELDDDPNNLDTDGASTFSDDPFFPHKALREMVMVEDCDIAT